jgi:hypothetical protein
MDTDKLLLLLRLLVANAPQLTLLLLAVSITIICLILFRML